MPEKNDRQAQPREQPWPQERQIPALTGVKPEALSPTGSVEGRPLRGALRQGRGERRRPAGCPCGAITRLDQYRAVSPGQRARSPVFSIGPRKPLLAKDGGAPEVLRGARGEGSAPPPPRPLSQEPLLPSAVALCGPVATRRLGHAALKDAKA